MKRGYLYAAFAAIIAVCLWAYGQRHRHDNAVDAGIKSTELAPTVQTKVIVDPRRHTITTVTRGADGKVKTTGTFLPGTGASISLGVDKSVLVTSRSWGTEVNPFMGFALGSDIRARAALGLNLFYIQRWEVGGGLLLATDIKDSRVFVHVSYNPYSNLFVSAGIDNQRTAHLIAGLKF